MFFLHVFFLQLSLRCEQGSLAYITSFSLSSCTIHIYEYLCSLFLSIPPSCSSPSSTPPPSSLAFSFSDTEKPTPPSLSHAFTPDSLGTQIPISPSLARSVVFIIYFFINPPISVNPPVPQRVLHPFNPFFHHPSPTSFGVKECFK